MVKCVYVQDAQRISTFPLKGFKDDTSPSAATKYEACRKNGNECQTTKNRPT